MDDGPREDEEWEGLHKDRHRTKRLSQGMGKMQLAVRWKLSWDSGSRSESKPKGPLLINPNPNTNATQTQRDHQTVARDLSLSRVLSSPPKPKQQCASAAGTSLCSYSLPLSLTLLPQSYVVVHETSLEHVSPLGSHVAFGLGTCQPNPLPLLRPFGFLGPLLPPIQFN